MRVAIVSPYALDVVGGVQAHVLALADALHAAGDEVIVLGPSATGGGLVPTAGGVRIVDVGPSVPVPANGSRAPVALAPAAALRIRRILERARPDVVHVHEPLVPVVGPVAALTSGAARVLTFHATAEGGVLPRLYRGIRAPGRAIVERADALTAVSPVAAAFHARMLALDVGRFAIVPNGVDVARFAAHRATGARRTDELVFLGRLEHRKGADLAVRAFLRVATERPDARLRVLGDGPLAPMIARLVADAAPDVAARIELSGRADPADLPRLLARADVAILPARGGESFGIVLLEAMAAGCAVVATDIPGYRAVARHDREALLVPPGDIGALAAAAARLLEERSLADRLRTAGAARAAEHDWPIVARRMREEYERACSAAARPNR